MLDILPMSHLATHPSTTLPWRSTQRESNPPTCWLQLFMLFNSTNRRAGFFCFFQCSSHSFIFPLQAHCLCVQVICTSRPLNLYWWQCPVSDPDVAGKQTEDRWLFPECWDTFQQCLEGSRELLLGQIYTFSLRICSPITAKNYISLQMPVFFEGLTLRI